MKATSDTLQHTSTHDETAAAAAAAAAAQHDKTQSHLGHTVEHTTTLTKSA
jgi:hypothetical protein